MSDLRDKARRYQEAIHRILMQVWDPIGVSRVPEAHDEYDAYVAGVYGRLLRGTPRQDVFDYLWQVETKEMGLNGDRQRTERTVDLLLDVPRQIR